MTVQRRPHRARRFYALALSVLILWLVSVTAASGSIQSALSVLSQRTDLALSLLRSQLGTSLQTDDLPSVVAFAISQSPLLLSGHSAVLELRRSAEQDSPAESPPPSGTPVQKPGIPDTSIYETPEDPETPLVFVDNGVSAKTLVPSSPDGYVVVGDVYIDNRSDKPFDASLFSEPVSLRLSPADTPQVLIVHTHGSEAYTMPAGQEYIPCGDCRTTDANYSVLRVGEEIASLLRSAGICVLHDTSLHDYPNYSGAYDRSLATVEQYLERYPSIVLVLDIHRDAISDNAGNIYKVVSAVAGLNAAQMSFVIGTDGGGLHHPDWQENLRLAVAIQQALSSEHPTLMRPITVRNSRYNQHTTTGSLLIEMGAAGNSLDEALLSAQLLSNAILNVLLASPSDPPAPEIPS